MKAKILSVVVPICILLAMAGCGHRTENDLNPADTTNSSPATTLSTNLPPATNTDLMINSNLSTNDRIVTNNP